MHIEDISEVIVHQPGAWWLAYLQVPAEEHEEE